MNAHVQQLLNSVLALPEPKRAEFIDALIASMPNETPPFDGSWIEIVQRRWADFEAGRTTTWTWEDVKRRAREQRVA